VIVLSDLGLLTKEEYWVTAKSRDFDVNGRLIRVNSDGYSL